MSDDKRVVKYVDEAMYEAKKIDATTGPRVTLVSMTSDPLANIAVAAAVYKGDIKRTHADVTDEERAYYLEQMKLTKLAAPLETIHMFFQIEGVTRAFTHQMVRQRTAVYFQESMRFAVKETMPVGLPPSLVGVKRALHDRETEDLTYCGCENNTEQSPPIHQWCPEFPRLSDPEKMLTIWNDCVENIEQSYNLLIGKGMPAEDARGLAPTNVLTRINYDTNLRSLQDHAGNRLCTQAQFEWRQVFSGIVQALREQGPKLDARPCSVGSDTWQRIKDEYAAIATLLQPICYQVGHCTFKADFDRKCSIRSRVDANADINRPSSEWAKEYDIVDPTETVVFNPEMRTARQDGEVKFIGAIRPEEWLLDPSAAR
jgi:flavin-dependent thymidylate synthase